MAPSLAPWLTALRLSLHVISAAIWVGGQFTLAGLVGAARRLSPDAPKALARAFARVSWPAYAVVMATGVWNVAAVHPEHASTAWHITLDALVVTALLSGVAAFIHSRATARAQLAIWGAVSGLSALAAMVLGVLVAG